MKKLLLTAICLTVLTSTVLLKPAEALTKTESTQLLTGTLISEHLRRKDCDPLLNFGITLGVSILQQFIQNNRLDVKDLTFQCSGIIVSYGFDEIANFILNGISLEDEKKTKT